MMRKAASIVRAHHVVVVSHMPRVRELADVVVEVANGKVRTETNG
jgi:ABC-type lipoprotein export system ATPase subunit